MEDDNDLGGVVTIDHGGDMIEMVEGDLVDPVLRELEEDNELEGRMTTDKGD